MTKNTIKTQKAQKTTARASKATAPKATTYAARIASGESIESALRKTRDLRRAFLTESVFLRRDFGDALTRLATRFGASYKGGAYDFRASYPLKSDLARLATIRPFANKTRDHLTPRMIAALALAYLNRDRDDGFARVFANGLFLENGALTDLLTGGFIKDDGGDGARQRFAFDKKTLARVISSDDFATLATIATKGGKA